MNIFTKTIERAKVMLRPRLETNVPEIRRVWNNRAEDVTEHRPVNLTVVHLHRSVAPRDVEHVRDVSQRRKLGSRVFFVGDIALDVIDGMIGVPGGTGTASDAVDFPRTSRSVGERKDLR